MEIQCYHKSPFFYMNSFLSHEADTGKPLYHHNLDMKRERLFFKNSSDEKTCFSWNRGRNDGHKMEGAGRRYWLLN